MYVKVMHGLNRKPDDWQIADSWRKACLWGWNAENFSFIVQGLTRTGVIPIVKKMRYGFKVLGDNIFWTIWPFLMGVIGWLPGKLAEREFLDLALYYSAPRLGKINSILFFLILVYCITLIVMILPKEKVSRGFVKTIVHFFEWVVFLPLAIFLNSLAAFSVQLRLLRGKYEKS